MVALLFKKLGPTFMAKMRGSFAFAVYDAHVGRVLAANDVTASNNLWQGHIDADACLVVACNLELPGEAVADRSPIGAGEYKFGWRAAPIAYMASQATVKSRCNEAMQAAMAALAVRHPAALRHARLLYDTAQHRRAADLSHSNSRAREGALVFCSCPV